LFWKGGKAGEGLVRAQGNNGWGGRARRRIRAVKGGAGQGSIGGSYEEERRAALEDLMKKKIKIKLLN